MVKMHGLLKLLFVQILLFNFNFLSVPPSSEGLRLPVAGRLVGGSGVCLGGNEGDTAGAVVGRRGGVDERRLVCVVVMFGQQDAGEWRHVMLLLLLLLIPRVLSVHAAVTIQRTHLYAQSRV